MAVEVGVEHPAEPFGSQHIRLNAPLSLPAGKAGAPYEFVFAPYG